MKTNKVILIANVSKSQIKDTGTHWEIKTIPVTVDDAVMNNILYPADENERGLTSLLKKPIALSHPVDDEGNFMSAGEGEGLQNFFSGGVITNVYNVDGINYADASIKKSTLNAQDDGQWYANALESKSDIGVSTGLIIPQNMESGTAKDGTPYEQTAINQVYDHLAMLKPEEAPAGGDATFMRFNAADSNDDVFVVNLAEHMPEKEKALFDKFMGIAKAFFASNKDNSYNQDSGHEAENLTNKAEVAKVDKKKLMARMKKAGMNMGDYENMDVEKMFNAYDEYMDKKTDDKKSNMDDDEMKDKDKMDKKEMKKNSSDSETPEWALALNARFDKIEGQLTANSQSEKSSLEGQVLSLAINGLNESAVKALPVESLKSLLAANGHVNVNHSGGFSHAPSNTKLFNKMEAPE